MAARRALVPESELKRWAKVSLEMGVTIRHQVSVDGAVTLTVAPRGPENDSGSDDDIDDRLNRFASK